MVYGHTHTYTHTQTREMQKTCTETINHERPDKLGCWGELERIARFKRPKVFDEFLKYPSFLGGIGKASLSEFPEIYAIMIWHLSQIFLRLGAFLIQNTI